MVDVSSTRLETRHPPSPALPGSEQAAGSQGDSAGALAAAASARVEPKLPLPTRTRKTITSQLLS